MVKKEQEKHKGIDALYQMSSGESWIVDEKAQLNYLNRPLETFAFEIIYKRQNNKNILTQGWFINDDLKTTHYLLVYPHSDQVKSITTLKIINNFQKQRLYWWRRLN